MELKYIVCDFNELLDKSAQEQQDILNELLPKILEYKITLDKRIQCNLYRHAVKSPTWTY
ncbi:hypothetical protein SNE85_003498 [Vibrio cholerae]|uniref:hypothetical protein n=1 Tax=Vibrio cholerae TaxID=666 RepID=UPI0011EF0375|nr:hypothetical protein [Vibrio cholerae]EGR2468774.1 hypothetical protein [Vibrio cholerae]ELY5181577.1 hypothetical protein [Vibrio cholerae]TYW41470.1 hypothetical protein FY556_17270 [Vibrio cholerae]TYW48446.1 hypothetical protein FY558_17545 [Vibrio cholerae]